MIFPNRLPILSLLLAAGMLVGCTSSPISRIDANRDVYETWPPEIKEAVLSGRVEKGMTPKMVEVALGKPDDVRTRPSRSGQQEVWIYRKGGSPLGNTNVGVGVGVGPVSVGTGGIGGGGGYVDERQVVFQDGVVESSDFGGP